MYEKNDCIEMQTQIIELFILEAKNQFAFQNYMVIIIDFEVLTDIKFIDSLNLMPNVIEKKSLEKDFRWQIIQSTLVIKERPGAFFTYNCLIN